MNKRQEPCDLPIAVWYRFSYSRLWALWHLHITQLTIFRNTDYNEETHHEWDSEGHTLISDFMHLPKFTMTWWIYSADLRDHHQYELYCSVGLWWAQTNYQCTNDNYRCRLLDSNSRWYCCATICVYLPILLPGWDVYRMYHARQWWSAMVLHLLQLSEWPPVGRVWR